MLIVFFVVLSGIFVEGVECIDVFVYDVVVVVVCVVCELGLLYCIMSMFIEIEGLDWDLVMDVVKCVIEVVMFFGLWVFLVFKVDIWLGYFGEFDVKIECLEVVIEGVVVEELDD